MPTMLRTTSALLTASARRLPKSSSPIGALLASQTRRSASSTIWRARAPATASSRQLVPFVQRAQYAAKNEPDVQFEKDIAKRKLESDPEHVTSESSVRHLEGPGERPVEASAKEGLVGDVRRMGDALALRSVPPLSYRLGFAGTIPYFGTSLATVFLSWDLNREWPSQSEFLNHIMISHEQAAHYLHLLEPIQVGYGAVIISFLGAIHWGLEYAEKTPNAARTRFRYGLGVIAPIIAWPSMLLPVHFALTAQFAAFTFMYFMDTRAATRGWTPPWYGTYRFVLTFIVGSALLISLIGRQKVGADKPRLTGLREKLHKEGQNTMEKHQWEREEAKEKERIHKQKEEEEKQKQKEEKTKKSKGDDTKGQKDDSKDSKADGKDESEENSKDEGKDEDKKDSKDEGKKDSKDDSKDEGKSESKQDEGKGESKQDEGKGESTKDEGKGDSKKDEGGDGKEDGKSDDKNDSKGGDKKEDKDKGSGK